MKRLLDFAVLCCTTGAIVASQFYIESNCEGNMKTPLRKVPARLKPIISTIPSTFNWR